MLADGTFLSSYSSNEDTELIVETYRNILVAKNIGDVESIIASTFTYDIVSRKVPLSRSQYWCW